MRTSKSKINLLKVEKRVVATFEYPVSTHSQCTVGIPLLTKDFYADFPLNDAIMECLHFKYFPARRAQKYK